MKQKFFSSLIGIVTILLLNSTLFFSQSISINAGNNQIINLGKTHSAQLKGKVFPNEMKVEWLCHPKMFSTNSGDYYLTSVISKDEKDTTLAASCVLDSKKGNIILKLINGGTQPWKMKINLSDFKNVIPGDEQTVLTGDAEAENTFDNPQMYPPKNR